MKVRLSDCDRSDGVCVGDTSGTSGGVMGAASSEGASSGIACVSRASLEKTIASAFLIVVRASSRLVSLARSSAQLSAMSVSSERPFVMVILLKLGFRN